MKFLTNDHKTLKETIDEIKNFEGIQHNHLVSYYGVEVFKVRILLSKPARSMRNCLEFYRTSTLKNLPQGIL